MGHTEGLAQQRYEAHASAAREALEEAGVIGRTNADTIGIYHYKKRLTNGLDVCCKVEVFAFKVRQTGWPPHHGGRRQGL